MAKTERKDQKIDNTTKQNIENKRQQNKLHKIFNL